jgi:recombination protein RecA
MALRSLAPHLISDIPVFRAADLKAAPGGKSWQLQSLVGVLAEISEETSAGAASLAVEIIADAQDHNEPVAWVAGSDSIFFPPDLADSGIDLAAVTVIRAGGENGSLIAAEWLVRSGAFGLVVVDADGDWKASDASLGRLLKLAERSQAAVVFLTRKRCTDPSLGSRISVRGSITRSGEGPFHVVISTVKDKRANTGSRQGRQYDGPPGMH